MIIVHLCSGEHREYKTAARFLTEDVFNNLCLHDDKDELIAVFAPDHWVSVEIDGNGQTRQT